MTSILPHITIDTGENPRYSLIWLHGLGADGEDFVPLANELNLPVAVRYLFPHAPKRPVTINGGLVMRAWYDIASNDLGLYQDAAGIRESQTALEALIAQERARGVSPERIFLAGFSQGGAVVLHTALRQPVALAGVLALSTYLPLADSVAAEATRASQQTPIFMAHGSDDPIIPLPMASASAAQLRALNYELEWYDYPMQHSVNAQELQDIETWLTKRILASA